MADNENFVVKVTADVSEAGKGFDELLRMVDGAAEKVGGALGKFDGILKQSGGSLLQTAAAMTPFGRSAMVLMETLAGAASAGRDLAEQLGTADQWTNFERSLSDLGGVIASTFEGYDRTLQHAVLGTADSTEQMKSLYSSLLDFATNAMRQFQFAIESTIPEDRRSNLALEAEITARQKQLDLLRQMSDLEAQEAERQRAIAAAGPEGTAAIDAQTEALTNRATAIAENEAAVERLQAILARRVSLDVLFTDRSPAAERALEMLRKQNEELEISIATFGMAAGAAAAYRAELQAIGMIGAEARDRGRAPNPQDIEAAVAEVRRQAELRQRLSDMETGRRGGQQAERILGGGENQIRQLEAQAEAFGKTAEEAARLAFEERLLGQLRQANIPLTDKMVDQIGVLADRYGEAQQQLKNMQLQQQQAAEVGRVFSSSFERLFSDAISGAEVKWDQFFKKLLADLAMLAIRQNILQPLFGGGGVAGGGLFGSLVSGIAGVPGRADGGPVDAGMPYMVGERGPELFVPDTAGAIVPNGAGGSSVINMRIDLAGANGDETIARIAGRAASAAALQAVEASNRGFAARQHELHLLGE